MSNADMQAIWDRHLITGWVRDLHIYVVAINFVRETNPELVRVVDGWREVVDDHAAFSAYLVSLNLRRCLDKGSDGTLRFSGKGPTRAFIHSRCKRLSSCLWSDKFTAEQIVQNLHRFKWIRLGPAAAKETAENRRVDKKFDNRDRILVNPRQRDKRTDWHTVK